MSEQQEKAASLQLLRGLLRRGLRVRKAVRASKDKAPKSFAKAINEKNVNKAWAGYKQQGSGGTDSLVMFLPEIVAEKAFGKERVRDAVWKGMHAPALRADTAVGHVLGKIPGTKKLFTATEKVPWGKNLYKDIERSSALAPLNKIRDIGAPIIVGVGLEKGVRKITGLGNNMHDQEMREKVASTMLRLHEENKEHTKRAHAMRLLYKKAELGLEHVPQNYQELEEKLAAMETQDLVVLEKALELAGGHLKLGEVDSSSRITGVGATEQFQAAVLGDEI